MSFDNLETVLASVPFFEVCTSDHMHLLAFASEWQNAGEGDVLFSTGDASDGAYVLVDGTVEIRDDDLDTREGAEVGASGYQVSGPGVLLGEMGLLLDKPRNKTIAALSPLSLVFVPRPVFAKLMRQYPEVAAASAARIRQEMGGYIKELNKFKRL